MFVGTALDTPGSPEALRSNWPRADEHVMRRAWTAIRPALAVLGLLAGMAVVVDGSAAGPAQAVGILPPANPSANRPLDPAQVAACEQPGANQSATCEQEALVQIDAARSQEGVGPMTLPSDFLVLNAPEQLAALIALERSARGLPVPAGLVAAYDQDAQLGADNHTDPAAPPGYATFGTIEAQGIDSVLVTGYEWMYDDGYGSANLSCTSPSFPACWVHRDVILGDYSATSYFYMGTAQGAGPAYAAVLAASLQHQPVLPLPTRIALTRLAGANRDLTSVAISQVSFPGRGSARSVVLATDADYPDALAGTPLAVAAGGPVLLSTPTTLDPAVGSEIERVLAQGGTVYVLGGSAAVSQAVSSQVQALGYKVVREAGPDRFATAVAIASTLGDPPTVFVADGTQFADALVAGPAAAKANGAILLSNGRSLPSDTAAYLSSHPGAVYAIGAGARFADPHAQAVGGADDFASSIAVARTFFGATSSAGFASEATYPDELSGDAQIAAKGSPMILAPASGALPSSVASFLSSSAIASGYLYGGTSAVSSGVQSEISGV
jgi:hypothetical protein